MSINIMRDLGYDENDTQVKSAREQAYIQELANIIEQHAPGLDQTAVFDGTCSCYSNWSGSEESHAVHRASKVLDWIENNVRT